MAGTYAYVTDYGHAVTFVDLDREEIRATVEVGPYSPRSIAVDSRGRRVYVANQCGPNDCVGFPEPGSVSVIDTASASIVATVTVGRQPDHLVVDHAGRRLYVSNDYDPISVVDTATDAVVGSVPVRGGPLAISRDDARLYAAGWVASGDRRLALVDLATGTVKAESRTRDVRALALDRRNRRLFVAYCDVQCETAGAYQPVYLDVLDAVTLDHIVTILVGDDFAPGGLAVDRTGRLAYLSGYGILPERSVVWTIDVARAAVTSEVTVPTLASDVAMHPHKPRLYATAFFQGDALSVIDTKRNSVETGLGPLYSFRIAVGRAARTAR